MPVKRFLLRDLLCMIYRSRMQELGFGKFGKVYSVIY